MSYYEKKLLKLNKKSPKIKMPELLCYIKDIIYTFCFSLFFKQKFTICIAADNLNCLCAIFLRKMRLVNKIIYFSIDYSPKRFKNRFLNVVYHMLDRLCCYNADIVWNTNSVMEKMRRINNKKYALQIEVQNGVEFDSIKRKNIEDINRYNLVFIGHIVESKGIELLIQSIPYILKSIPKVKLIIIGSGPLEKRLYSLVNQLQIKKSVEFKGFISDVNMMEILTTSAIGIATYVDEKNNLTYYSDPLKPKLYMASGLPIIITKVPKIWKLVKLKEAGIVIDFKQDQIVKAVILLLSDDILYAQTRENAINLASNYKWSHIYKEAFKITFDYFNDKSL